MALLAVASINVGSPNTLSPLGNRPRPRPAETDRKEQTRTLDDYDGDGGERQMSYEILGSTGKNWSCHQSIWGLYLDLAEAFGWKPEGAFFKMRRTRILVSIRPEAI